MSRLVVLLVLAVVVVAVTVWYRRRSATDVARGTSALPALPDDLQPPTAARRG